MTCVVPGSAPGSADALQRSPRNLSHMPRSENLREGGGLRSEGEGKGRLGGKKRKWGEQVLYFIA